MELRHLRYFVAVAEGVALRSRCRAPPRLAASPSVNRSSSWRKRSRSAAVRSQQTVGPVDERWSTNSSSRRGRSSHRRTVRCSPPDGRWEEV